MRLRQSFARGEARADSLGALDASRLLSRSDGAAKGRASSRAWTPPKLGRLRASSRTLRAVDRL